jgi:hypothetical protein
MNDEHNNKTPRVWKENPKAKKKLCNEPRSSAAL